jgi:hypothetical protein
VTTQAAEAPRFIHDCSSCIFLGVYDSGPQWGGTCDLYFCPSCGDGSVIARYSDEGPDYRSGMITLYAPDRRTARHVDGTPADMGGYPLHEAYDRVIARGMWKPRR